MWLQYNLLYRIYKVTHYLFFYTHTNHVFLQTEYDIVEKVLENNFQTNYVFFSQRGREIKDLSKWERQIILKKMSPKSFCILNKNLQLIMEIIEFVETNQNAFLIEYLQKKGLHISLLKQFSKDMKEYIETHMSLEIAKNIDNVQTFDMNFSIQAYIRSWIKQQRLLKNRKRSWNLLKII